MVLENEKPYGELENLSMEGFARKKYLDYAISVVRGRALPEIGDGLKPVHRRILYETHRLGVGPTDKHRKVAMLVGAVMGKLHPHGDQSISDALVRMGQDFSLRYPLIDGQGNFGSRDGDGAAAPRYIEARLSKFAELMLSEIDKDTVDMVPNYDGTLTEPSVLPARLPFVLLNPTSGIAVGYSSEIPSHNIREVAAAACRLIRDRSASLDDLLEVMPGPDFACGGQIISPPAVLREMYHTGRGSLRSRARWRREDLARGQWQIVVYELPPLSSTAKVLEDIEEASNPRPKEGKKELSAQQKNLKQTILSLLDNVRDESFKDEPVRLVIEPKTSKISEDELMAVLLSSTSLELSVPVSMVILGQDGRPRQKGLLSILSEWVDFRFVTVERRLRHRLSAIERRLHILEGRAAVLLHLDEVIRIIRNSDDPKGDLIKRFGLTDTQAEDILEIRLRQLARLEALKIQRELDDLRAESTRLNHLLTSPVAFRDLILGEIEADSSAFGDDRRTLLLPVAPAARTSSIAANDEPVTLFISKNGWARARAGHRLDRAGITYKPGDAERCVLEVKTSWPLLLLDSNGRAYTIRVSDLPIGGRGDGVLMSSLVDLQSGKCGAGQLVHVLCGAGDEQFMFSNSAGYGFICSLEKLVSRHKAGKAFMVIEPGEVVLEPARAVDDHIYALCRGDKQSRMLVFEKSEMKVMPGGRGVQVMALSAAEALASVFVGARGPVTLSDGTRKHTLSGDDVDGFCGRRARRGAALPSTLLQMVFEPA